MNFASDNWAGAHPDILAAVNRANEGAAPSYGGDQATKRVEKKFSEIFEREVAVFLVATGTAANGLALATIAPPYGAILCHEESHIHMDECAAPEFFMGGGKLIPIKSANAKLTPESVETALRGYSRWRPHGAPASAVSLSQATECGTLYAADEMRALADFAHGAGMKVHVDGARFANAIIASGKSPAELSWKAGVDVLSFGGSKNGCLAAEAVIFFDPAGAADFDYRRKRAGHLWSKSRFLAAQFDAYFANGRWLTLAAHSNAMARRLADGLRRAGVDIGYEQKINAVFPIFEPAVADRLTSAGAAFYPWVTLGDWTGGKLYRLLCSWATRESDVDAFIAAVELARGR